MTRGSPPDRGNDGGPQQAVTPAESRPPKAPPPPEGEVIVRLPRGGDIDPVLAVARALAALYGARLFCHCGRDWIGGDGSCARCAEDADHGPPCEQCAAAASIRGADNPGAR